MKAEGYNSQNVALIDFCFMAYLQVLLTREDILTLYFLWVVGRYDDLLISILVIVVVRRVGCKPLPRVFLRK